MKKGGEDGCQPSKNDKVLINGMGGGSLKGCDGDLGCGEPDASGGWRQEYRHQMCVAAVAPEA